jgi:hypothetical protein
MAAIETDVSTERTKVGSINGSIKHLMLLNSSGVKVYIYVNDKVDPYLIIPENYTIIVVDGVLLTGSSILYAKTQIGTTHLTINMW